MCCHYLKTEVERESVGGVQSNTLANSMHFAHSTNTVRAFTSMCTYAHTHMYIHNICIHT